MNTLMQMGPMMVMEGPNGIHHHHHHHQPFPQPSQHIPQTPITSSMNRSQRCGVCRGCQCKPCGQCTYCQDSPQFGGPGVKKQSCIERRCLRVLENRLQRDAPTFKARVGCNQCEDCRMADCQICLVCLDRRFFDNRYMTGAMCAKKRCNNATSIELPAQSPQAMAEYQQRQAQKRAYEQSAASNQFHVDMKRRVEMGFNGHPVQVLFQLPQGAQQPPQQQTPPPQQQNGRVLAMNQSMNYGMPPMSAMRMQPMQPAGVQSVAQSVPMGSCPSVAPPTTTMQQAPNGQLSMSNGTPIGLDHQQQQQQQVQVVSSSSSMPPPPPSNQITYMMPSYGHSSPTSLDFYDIKPYSFEEIHMHNGDPFIPPSYAPEMKNAVVLQPL
ncbi:unnamed protein product [Auanema sp. JU1783]|nr:unnamed protein product [Auanema sp. JU1783]